MRGILLAVLILSVCAVAQQSPLQSPEQIETFARYLFNKQDYLRASEQYQIVLRIKANDTIYELLSECYIQLDTVELADTYIAKISKSSIAARGTIERYKFLFRANRFSEIISGFENRRGLNDNTSRYIHPLYHAACIRERKTTRDDDVISNIFPSQDRDSIAYYRNALAHTEKRNPYIAALLSTVIPGAGKMYTGRYGDGAMACISTGLFTYLSIINFQHHHNTRAYIFSALGGLYYASNIYGSAASAQVYNAEYTVSVQTDFDAFIARKNCFIDENEIMGLR